MPWQPLQIVLRTLPVKSTLNHSSHSMSASSSSATHSMGIPRACASIVAECPGYTECTVIRQLQAQRKCKHPCFSQLKAGCLLANARTLKHQQASPRLLGSSVRLVHSSGRTCACAHQNRLVHGSESQAQLLTGFMWCLHRGCHGQDWRRICRPALTAVMLVAGHRVSNAATLAVLRRSVPTCTAAA